LLKTVRQETLRADNEAERVTHLKNRKKSNAKGENQDGKRKIPQAQRQKNPTKEKMETIEIVGRLRQSET